MAIDTLRTNKMRSALTVLGVVIGITSIVGMTSLIRGFDNSLRELDPPARAGHDHRPEVGRAQLRRRPQLPRGAAAAQPDDGGREGDRARVPVGRAGRRLARRGPATRRSRIYYGRERTKQLSVFGATENWAAVNFAKVEAGRLFIPAEVEHRRDVVVLGNAPVAVALPQRRSDRQEGPHRQQPVHRHRRARQASEPGRLLDRRRRLRRHPLQRPTRSSTARCCKARRRFRRQLQSRGLPHRDDRRRARAPGMREAAHARGRGDHAHPPPAEARRSRTTSTWPRRTPS